jgi:Flp pilus assembly pilin Flp
VTGAQLGCSAATHASRRAEVTMNQRSRRPRTRPCWHPASISADETGATALEYGLIAALIGLVIIVGLTTLATDLAGLPMQALIDAMKGARA